MPEDPARYSQARARDDVIAVLDHLKIDKAHVVGLSMGGFATLHVGLASRERARSLVDRRLRLRRRPGEPEKFRAGCEALATPCSKTPRHQAERGKQYAIGPARVQLQIKNPRAWDGVRRALRRGVGDGARAHPARGADAASACSASSSTA